MSEMGKQKMIKKIFISLFSLTLIACDSTGYPVECNDYCVDLCVKGKELHTDDLTECVMICDNKLKLMQTRHDLTLVEMANACEIAGESNDNL